MLALTSMLMSICIPMGAQQPQTPVQGVVAHIDDSKLFPDSLPPQYRLPEGMTVEDVIRSLPGVEILEDGTITVDGKKISNHNFYFPNPSAVDSIVNMHGKEIKQETRAISPKDRGLVTNENYLAQLLEYAPEGLVCGYIMRNINCTQILANTIDSRVIGQHCSKKTAHQTIHVTYMCRANESGIPTKFRVNRFVTVMEYRSLQEKKSNRTGWILALRYLADSNRRTRFCRPIPSRSVKVPCQLRMQR